jgi:hypothetical protein
MKDRIEFEITCFSFRKHSLIQAWGSIKFKKIIRSSITRDHTFIAAVCGIYRKFKSAAWIFQQAVAKF